MNLKPRLSLRWLHFLSVVCLFPGCLLIRAQETAFTYQGRLSDGGKSATGLYDFQSAVYDAATGGNQISLTMTNANTPVSNGLFILTLDYGDLFRGSPCWLGLGVRTNGSAPFISLDPRQAITPVPYAMMAASASNLLGRLPAAQLQGAIASVNLSGSYTGAVSFYNASGNFYGNGVGLTNVPPTAISGTALTKDWPLYALAQTTTNLTFIPGTIGSNTAFSVPPSSQMMAKGDFDKNGYTDIAVILSSSPGIVVVYTNNAGKFASNATYTVGNNPQCITVADVNGDGWPDIIVANKADNTLTILTNNEHGAFGVFQTVDCSANGLEASWILAADLRGSGQIDLAEVQHNGNLVQIFTNANGGAYSLNTVVFPTGSSILQVLCADLFNRGVLDLMTVNLGSGTLSIMTNRSSALSYGPPRTLYLGASPLYGAVGLFSGTGLPDLGVSLYSTNGINLYTNDGAGGFAYQSTTQTPFNAASSLRMTAGDVNGDGFPDIVACDLNGNTMTILTNNGAGHFDASAVLTVGNRPVFPILDDINNDGTTDILELNTGSNTINTYTNSQSKSLFSQFTTLPSSTIVGMFTNISLTGQPVCNPAVASVTIPYTNNPGGFAPPGFTEYFADLTQSNMTILGGPLVVHNGGGNHSTEFAGYWQTVNTLPDIVPITLAFSMYGSEFMIDTMGRGQSAYIVVDDLYNISETNHITYTLPSDGNNYFVDVKLAGAGFHTIRVIGVYSILGVMMPNGNGISKYPTPKTPVLVMGDSVTEKYSSAWVGGAGGWCDFLNLDPDFRYCDFWRYGEGGTGWMATASGGRTNLMGRITDIIAANPKYLLIELANDSSFDTNSLFTNVFNTCTNIMARCRSDQKRLVGGPFPLGRESVSGDATWNDTQIIRAAALTSGFITSANQFMDWTTPPLITGNAINGTSSGSASTFTDPSDQVHPNILGMRNIATRFKPFLLQNWPELMSSGGTGSMASLSNGVVSYASNRSALTPITPSGSPFNWTNSFPMNGFVLVSGGTPYSSAINGTAVSTTVTGQSCLPLQPGEWVTITYGVPPLMFWKPQ